MKAKTLAAFFVALLVLASQFSLRAQSCYGYQCPQKIFAPCEGVYGARVSYTITASNLCNPSLPPTVTYSIPPGSLFPPGTNIVCATIQIPGLPPQQCCFQVIVDNCCPTNCIDIICPSNVVVGCQQAGGSPGAFVVLPQPAPTNYCGDHTIPANYQIRCMPQSQPGQPVFFPPGTNNVVCCISDSQGFLRCCCFNVLVTNCPPQTGSCQPLLACPTDISISCQSPSGAVVFFPPAKITNPCNVPILSSSCTHVSGSVFPNGKTTVACCITYQDPLTGLVSTECCCFDVVVRCCQPTNCVSTLTCPNDMTIDCPPAAGTVLNYIATGTNNCGEPITVICDPPSGSTIFGPTNVCCRLLNSGVVVTQCCFHVLVLDTTPPDIHCPGDITVISTNCQPVPVAIPVVTASDNCDPNPTVSCTPIPNAFPCGTTTISCTAVDSNGNSNRCAFNVTVICNNNPQITCPPDITVNCASPTGVVVTFTVTVTNSCSPTAPSVTCSPASGSVFLPGTTTVCCSAGATGPGCCFKVTVIPDDVPPQIQCPTNVVVVSPNCTTIDVSYPAPTATDNCQLDYVRCTPPSNSPFPVGVSTVLCCAVDKAGNSNCCNFTVTVRCPTNCIQVVCPTNVVVDCAGPNGAVVTYTAYAIDTCTGVTVPLTCSRPSGSVFPIGATIVCCTNTAAAAAPVWCCFDVTVRTDTQPPTITCPSNIVVTSPNCVPINVPYPAPTATDNCQLDSVTCNPPATFNFPVGVTTVTCCAVDKSGNSNCCNFTITVRCPTNCVQVVCPTNLVINCAGPNGAVVTYTAYAIDNCTGNIMPVTCTRPSGSVFPIGATVVCCTNTTAGVAPIWCCFDVTVRPDTQPPSITCPSNIVVTSPNCVPINVPYPAPTASDDCQLDSVSCNPPVTFNFPVGVTTVTCCAVDKSGNSNCCTFTITVRCPTNCVQVICPTNVIVDCAGPNGAVVTYTAYAIDNCTGNLLPVTCSRPSGTFFPIGATVVCCTNTVAGAAPVWCCFDVTVKRDTLPPVINCPSNIYQLCVKPNGSKINYTVTATDNCDTFVVVTCVPPSGSLFHPGCSNVVCTATDSAGNTSTCTFRVCLLSQGCYVRNPSFELLLPPPLPVAAACGDPIALALGWSALSGTPDLFRPPFASIVPGNCRGQERPCDGTNYAGLEGGYTSSGGFTTEEMMGTLIFPLNNGDMFRLRACLSLAETSPGPVLLEFALANSANLAQQVVIHQVMVTQTNGWLQYLPPCFRVPQTGNWDRLIIRAARVPTGTHTYQLGYVYVDNVNICCCKPKLISVVLDPNVTTVTWDGTGQLQGSGDLSDPTGWHDIDTPVEIDPDTGDYRTRVPSSPGNLFFRVVGPDNTAECSECGAGG